MRLQETNERQEDRAEDCQGHPAQAATTCGRNREGRAEAEDTANRQDGVPQVREQSGLRLASADERRRRIFDAVPTLHQV